MSERKEGGWFIRLSEATARYYGLDPKVKVVQWYGGDGVWRQGAKVRQ
jgi:hypothetical protein